MAEIYGFDKLETILNKTVNNIAHVAQEFPKGTKETEFTNKALGVLYKVTASHMNLQARNEELRTQNAALVRIISNIKKACGLKR